MKGFKQTYDEIIGSIDKSLKENKIITSLILLYSAIDSFSNLANRTNSSGRQIFIKWVDKWMLNDTLENVAGIDLYAARCGILHGFISESDLSNKDKAKQILYSYGEAPPEIPNKAIKSSDQEERYVGVKVEDLFESFRSGFRNCYEQIERDNDWKSSFEQKARKYFVSIPYK
jgi:hypothetical protein